MKECRDSQVSLSVADKKAQLVVSFGGGVYRLQVQADAVAGTLPPVFHDERPVAGAVAATFNPEELVRAFKAVLPAADKADASIVSAVHMSTGGDGRASVVATNKKHLFWQALRLPIGIPSFTLPLSASKGFFAVAEGCKSVTLRVSPASLVMESENGDFATQLEHGKFPDCSVIFKPFVDARRFFSVKREVLLGAVSRAALLHQDSGKINFTLNARRGVIENESSLTVQNTNPEFAFKEEFPLHNGDCTFESLLVGLNPHYLQSALNGETLDDVEFWVPGLTQDNAPLAGPILMRSEKSDFQAVIMPVRQDA